MRNGNDMNLHFNNLYFETAFLLLIIMLLFGKRFFDRHTLRINQSKRCLIKLKQINHPAQKINYLKKINAYTFEELILTAIDQSQEARIRRNHRYSGDGGIDGRFKLGNDLYMIQAKRYKDAIQLAHVKQFAEQVRKAGCRGIFVHTGRTPESAWEHLKNYREIEIISGNRLIELIECGYKKRG